MTRQCQRNNRGCRREGATGRQKGWEGMLGRDAKKPECDGGEREL